MAKPAKKARRTLRALADEAGLTMPKPIAQRKRPKKATAKPARKR
jgi:hypothetical protein